jgi:hypothetical protein
MVVIIGTGGCCSGGLILWALARQYRVCLFVTTFARPVDRGVRTATRLRLKLVYVVVATWSKTLFVIFIIFQIICTSVDDY